MKTASTIAVITIMLAGSLAGIGSFEPAAAETHIVGDVLCDNSFAIYTGDVAGNALVLRGGGAYPHVTSIDITTGDPAIYLVAWSDNQVHQGLLHDLTLNGVPHWSDNPSWVVFATGHDLNGDYPGVQPAAADLGGQIATANRNGLWQPITVGGPNDGSFPGSDSWQAVDPIPAAVHWAWFNSGRESGTEAPFRPGFNHGEYLIFRLLADMPSPIESRTWSAVKGLYR
jgi:hypothetical protein